MHLFVREPGPTIDRLLARHEEGSALMFPRERPNACVVEREYQRVVRPMIHEDAALDPNVLGDRTVPVQMGLVDVQNDCNVWTEVDHGFQLKAGYRHRNRIGDVVIQKQFRERSASITADRQRAIGQAK